MSLRRVSLSATVWLSILIVSACVSAQQQDASVDGDANDQTSLSSSQDSRIRVEGVVRRVGSDPFPRTVITDDEGTDWYIQSDDVSLFQRYENRRVEVRGIPDERVMELANGTTIGTRRELKDIEIISGP